MSEAIEVVDIFADMALDNKAEEGVWAPYRGDVEFLIAHSKSKKFRDRAAYLYRKNSRMLEGNGKVARDKLDEITITVMSETVLLGWRGALVFQGEKLEYTRANAVRLLAIDGIREWVSKQADDMTSYKAVQEAEDTKN